MQTNVASGIAFEDFVAKAVREGEPLSQNAGEGDLGFGWLYYGYVRNLRPDFAVAIGSRRGFSAFCIARALQDNGRGHLIFIDPSYEGSGHPGWSGGGLWSDPQAVAERIDSFGLGGWMTHLKMTSAEAFPVVRLILGSKSLGVVLIDGAHTYENSIEDFDLYSSLMDEGVVLFHDSTSTACDVSKTIGELRSRGHSMVTLYREVGMTAVEITRGPSVEQTWSYLCGASDRADQLVREAQSVVAAGDRVFEMYCGYSPFAAALKDVSIFGFDRDLAVIERLRREAPQHRWAQIDEACLVHADLPDEIDVLIGLGVTRGHAAWDPRLVLENTRYLLGRYRPRACMFEAALDYNDAEIINDLSAALQRNGFACRTTVLETTMSSFSRRKVLLASRAS